MNVSIGGHSIVDRIYRDAELKKQSEGRVNPYLGPRAAAEENIKETLVNEGAKYRLYVLTNSEGEYLGYRLREIPIDPERDYSQVFKDFMTGDDLMDGHAFQKALEAFNQGNEEFEKLIERSKTTY